MAQGNSVAQINAKRIRMSPGKIRERWLAGEDVSNERAIIRIGTMSTQIMIGAEDLSQWSDEELKRGQRRNKNGNWTGRKPKVVPKELHDELVKRTLARSQELMRENLEAAVEVLVDIATGADVEDKDRLKAIDMMMSRIMGKEPVKIELAAAKTKFEEAFEDMIVYDEEETEELEELEEADIVDDD